MLWRATMVLLAALVLVSCGDSHAMTEQDAAKLVTERFVRLEGVAVHDVSCHRQTDARDEVTFLCQTGTLDGRPVDALVIPPKGGAGAQAVPTLAVGRLEHLIERDFARRAGVPVIAAPCPRGVPYRRGAITTCQVAFLGGEREFARVTQTDGRGAVELTAPAYIATKLQRQIDAQLAAHHVRVTVRCPRGVLISSRARFACPLSDGSGRRVRVFGLDDSGAVRYELPGS